MEAMRRFVLLWVVASLGIAGLLWVAQNWEVRSPGGAIALGVAFWFVVSLAWVVIRADRGRRERERDGWRG